MQIKQASVFCRAVVIFLGVSAPFTISFAGEPFDGERFSEERLTGKLLVDSCKILANNSPMAASPARGDTFDGHLCSVYIQGFLDGATVDLQVQEEDASSFQQRALETRAKAPLARQKKLLKGRFCVPSDTDVRAIAREVSRATIDNTATANDVMNAVFETHYLCDQ